MTQSGHRPTATRRCIRPFSV